MSDLTPVSATTVLNVLSDVVDAVGGHPGNVTLLGFHAVDVGKILHVTMPSGEAIVDRHHAEAAILKAFGINKRTPDAQRAEAVAELRDALKFGQASPTPWVVTAKPTNETRELDLLVARLRRDEAARDIIRRERNGKRSTMASKLLTPTELAALPGLEPLIDGVLFKDTLAMLFGLPGTYKSFLAIAFACSVATGTKWLGRTVEQGPALIIAAEGSAGLCKRIQAWSAGWYDSKEVEGLTILPEAVNLSDDAQVDELAALNGDRRFALIIIDTWARSLGGADENSASATSLLIENVERIKRAHPGTTVLVVHHRGKNGPDPRGSIALLGGVDTALSLSGDRSALTLEATKQKDIEGGVIETLEAVRSITVDSLTLQRRAGTLSVATDLPEHLDESLAHFRRLFSATGATKAEFKNVLIELGLPKTTAYRHLNQLVDSKRLTLNGTRLCLPFAIPPSPEDEFSPLIHPK